MLLLPGSGLGFAGAGTTPFLLRTTSMGDTLWSRSYMVSGKNDISLHDFTYTRDRGFLLTGTCYPFPSGKEELWLIKTDSLGAPEWSRTGNHSLPVSLAQSWQAPDGSFLVVSPLSSPAGLLLLKIDSLGNMVWNKTYEIGENLISADLIVTEENDILLGAGSGDSLFLIRADSGGNMKQLMAAKYSSGYGLRLAPLSGGKYALGLYDGLVMSFDKTDNLEWARMFSLHQLLSVREISQKRLLITGAFVHERAGSVTSYVVTDSTGDYVSKRINLGVLASGDEMQDGSLVFSGGGASFLLRSDTLGSFFCDTREDNGQGWSFGNIYFVRRPVNVSFITVYMQKPTVTVSSQPLKISASCPVVVSIAAEEPARVSVTLSPHPVRGEATLSYSIPGAFRKAEVRLYTLAGNRVGSFPLPSGAGQLRLSAPEGTPGVYFYRVLADDQVVYTGKMVVVQE
jgi:hypothetical protein